MSKAASSIAQGVMRLLIPISLALQAGGNGSRPPSTTAYWRLRKENTASVSPLSSPTS